VKTSLSILVHGESGTGKSWLGDSAPYPRLIIDLEGRARYTPSGPKVGWDPRHAPPLADGTWSTCVATVTSFDELQMIYQWLRSGQHHFKSIVLDSLMEAQKRCIDSVAGLAQLDQQDWGTLLRKLESLVRSYRDLTLLPTNPVEVVVLIVGSYDQEGTRRPLLQGQLRTTVPYYLDVVGYLFPAPQPDGSLVRSLLIQPQPGFVAKDGTDTLSKAYGAVIADPNLETMYNILKGVEHPVPVDASTTTQEVAA